MNSPELSLSEDGDSSSDDSAIPAKRARADTLEAASTTSHTSYFQDSDDEPKTPVSDTYPGDFPQPKVARQSLYMERSPENNIRLSRSSLGENCSSPVDYDEDRSGVDEADNDIGEPSMRPSFQNNNDTFYSKLSEDIQQKEDPFGQNYSETSKRLMSNMGYKHGKGLGKLEDGRVQPVEAATQKGKRGFGLQPSAVGDVPIDFKWAPDDSVAEAKEEVFWMPVSLEDPLPGHILSEWIVRGPKKQEIDNETDFVEPQILKGILDSKTIFNSLDGVEHRDARTRSNPYETIGSSIFLNRAAVKMANMDAVFDFMFTNPKKQDGSLAVKPNELLYFADVCAGPGGFSEYVLYKKKWRAKGFGFTLKKSNDFKLSDFYAGTSETFNPYYGPKEDGDIYDPANLTSLKEEVLKHTEDKGVHFLMADGGFSVEGQENIQEVLSKRLYLCQCLAALMLVRTGGHFVVKLFDVFTRFSVGLLYIMYRCFEKVSIHKPVTSRPANSERYLVCKWKKLGTESTEQHLFSVNSMLGNVLDIDEDILELVPLNVLQENTEFYDYIYNSNCVIGEKQIKNLLKLAAFSKDKNLRELRQADLKKECLELWQIPDKVRTRPDIKNGDETLLSILSQLKNPPPGSENARQFKTQVLIKPPEYLETNADLNKFKNVYEWHFMYLSNAKNSSNMIFIGRGGTYVEQLESRQWTKVTGVNMPAKTLIYGEIINEYHGESSAQRHMKALHIIDAVMLGGEDISHYPLSKRIELCNLFCTAISKPFDGKALLIRCKRLFKMEHFDSALNSLEVRQMKNIRRAVTTQTPDRLDRNLMFYTVGSILFLKEVKEPWSAQMSKSHNVKYYFRISREKQPISLFEIPEDASLDAINTYLRRMMWSWGEAACAILENVAQRGVTIPAIMDHITKNIQR